MRPGTRVQRYTIDRCDARTGDELHTPEGPFGTVIEYDAARPYLPKIVIRWDTGRLETIEVGDEEPDRCLDDVTPRLFVNVYLWDRCYGGPEEGGWYFNAYAPQEEHSSEHATEAAAQAWLEKQLEWAQQENAERHHPNSVLSEGHYVVRLEAWPAEAQPAYRPCYE